MAMDLLHGATPTIPRPSSPLMKSVFSPNFRPTALPFSPSTTISIFALFSPHPCEAKAITLPKEQLVSYINDVESTIDQVQELGLNFFDSVLRVYDVVVNALGPAISEGVPVLLQAGEQVAKLAAPAVSEASMKAQEAIQSSGFDTGPVLSAAKTVGDAALQIAKIIDEAKPVAASTFESIASKDPVVIVGTAGSLYLTYILLPPIWSVISYNLRGYKGDLTPAQTLDLVSTKKHLLIDIRSEKDKRKAGVPRLPSSASSKMIAIPLEELPRNLRGLIKNVKKVEAEMVGLKISYLKKVGRGSSIVVMDSYGDSAAIVARALTRLGYRNSWVVVDGFSGRRGWLQSRLGADSYNVSLPEVVSPGRVPASIRRFGTASSTVATSLQKLLP